MTYRARPLILALIAAIVLVIALSKEAWIAIPIVAGVGVLTLTRGSNVGRGATVAALVVIASMALVAFGSVIAILSASARAMAALVFASGVTAIALGVIGLVLSIRYLRRVMQPSAPPADPASEPVASR
jgi:hypothetical protein